MQTHQLSKNYVSLELGEAISKMHDLLKREFGVDFAYTVAGQGNLLAASNLQDGYIIPLLRE